MPLVILDYSPAQEEAAKYVSQTEVSPAAGCNGPILPGGACGEEHVSLHSPGRGQEGGGGESQGQCSQRCPCKRAEGHH